MLLLATNEREKTLQSQERRNLKCALYWLFELVLQLCTPRVTTLHLCYMRMHSFLANQKRMFFSFAL